MAKVLVTGCAGFIGSHLVDELISAGHEVHGVDDLSNGKLSNLNPSLEFKELDVSDKYAIGSYIRRLKPEYIFHLAAMARISDCHEKPMESYEVNVLSSLYMLKAARAVGIKGFIFSSSSAVYGEPLIDMPISITDDLRPISIYGLQKLNAEQLVLAYSRVYGLNTAALRYFNVYGTARQNPNGAYPNVFAAFGRDAKTGTISIYGDGNQERDYIHVYDVVRANMAFLDIHDAWGNAYNVGTGETHTVNDIARFFKASKVYKKARVGDPSYSCANTAYTRKMLKWESQISFEQGVDIFLKSLENYEQ